MTLIWAIPFSGAAPHVAHLIPEVSGYTHRLCMPTRLVNRDLVMVVDSELYRPKCRTCQRLRRAMPQARVVVTYRPVIRSSAGAEAAWRKQR